MSNTVSTALFGTSPNNVWLDIYISIYIYIHILAHHDLHWFTICMCIWLVIYVFACTCGSHYHTYNFALHLHGTPVLTLHMTMEICTLAAKRTSSLKREGTSGVSINDAPVSAWGAKWNEMKWFSLWQLLESYESIVVLSSCYACPLANTVLKWMHCFGIIIRHAFAQDNPSGSWGRLLWT